MKHVGDIDRQAVRHAFSQNTTIARIIPVRLEKLKQRQVPGELLNESCKKPLYFEACRLHRLAELEQSVLPYVSDLSLVSRGRPLI